MKQRLIMMKSLAGITGLLILLVSSPANATLPSGEDELRERLGIPVEAKEVLIFAQSSHVDPDWLLRADQYQHFTDQAFDGAMVELARDPRYVYSVECVFFFRRYFEDHPELQDKLRDYVNQGRIRFSGVGVTTPDTLLPEAENILRDYLVGLNWLRSQGMNLSSRIAYLPDDFGHSPTLPSMLRELGIRYAVMTRVDGVHTPTADYHPAEEFPRPGSSAELLFMKLMTTDFVWAGPDGAEVIAHVNPAGYDMGDLIAHGGGAVMLGVYLALPARATEKTNPKIDGYIARLKPLSLTGYMFCPIGGDFNPPVKELYGIIDAYNRERYPQTGVWVTLAGLEDYMDLVAFHKDRLPVVQLDPNPYWTGFYSSRPGLKQACRKLSRSLYLAEALGVINEDRGLASYPDLTAAWEVSAMSNHHDFITGTSRTKVLNNEQLPLLAEAQEKVDQEIERLSSKLEALASPLPPPIKWQLESGGDRLTVENEFYLIEMDAKKGGCLTRWLDRATGREILAGPSNDIVIYRENGGLYSMGMEVYQGTFKEVARASDFPARIEARDQDGVLAVTVESEFAGHAFTRELFFRLDSPAVRMRLIGRARNNRTVTVRFEPRLSPGRFVQAVPYGVVERPVKKFFSPTFWAVKDWVDLVDESDEFGVHLAVTAPGSVAAREDGSLEAVALRNARAERTNWILPAPHSIVANGVDAEVHEFDYAFWPHGPEAWLERGVFSEARYIFSDPWIHPREPDLEKRAFSLIQTDRPEVIVTAIKKAESGDGVIVRLMRYGSEPLKVKLTYFGNRKLREAFRTDGLERGQEPLPIVGNQVELTMDYAIATVLLK